MFRPGTVHYVKKFGHILGGIKETFFCANDTNNNASTVHVFAPSVSLCVPERKKRVPFDGKNL